MNAHSSSPDPDKRRRILDAAVQIIARDGYSGARVADIAKTAGVADGTIYRYFESKEDLLLTLFEEMVGGFLDEARLAIEGETNALRKLSLLASIHLGKLAKNRDLAVVFQVELRHSMHHLTHITRSRLRVYLQLIKSILVEGQESGLVRRNLDPNIATHVIFGSLDALITSWLLTGQPQNLEGVGDELTGILTSGIAFVPEAKPRNLEEVS